MPASQAGRRRFESGRPLLDQGFRGGQFGSRPAVAGRLFASEARPGALGRAQEVRAHGMALGTGRRVLRTLVAPHRSRLGRSAPSTGDLPHSRKWVIVNILGRFTGLGPWRASCVAPGLVRRAAAPREQFSQPRRIMKLRTGPASRIAVLLLAAATLRCNGGDPVIPPEATAIALVSGDGQSRHGRHDAGGLADRQGDGSER